MSDNYTVAMYIRLSSEDENDGESNSIKNQRDLLTGFIRENAELSGCKLLGFCDDGYSGTNFDRPKIKELLDKTRKGLIQCIVVKDFSRFGRNYIEVGDYIEQVFPFLGVRFISVNDNYDSDNDYNSIGGIEIALRALIYDLYSKDLSLKVKSGKMAKVQKGEFLGGYAPFGYVKEEGKNHLIIDPEAATIVRKIFDLAILGTNAFEIAKILNADMTPTKAQYKKHTKGYTTWDKRTINIDNSFWTDTYVRKVIVDETYIGTVVSGKVRCPSVGSKKMKPVPKNEWIRIPDMHEAIVTKEEFELANKMIRVPPRKKNVPKERYLYSKVRCHCCGRALKRVKQNNPLYLCDTPRFKPSPNCVTEPITEFQIEEALLSAIKLQATSVIDMDKARVKKNNQITDRKQELHKVVLRCEGMINNLTATRQELYELYADGQINLDGFLLQKEKYNDQIEELTAKIVDVKVLISDCDDTMTDMAHTTAIWNKALDIDCLSKELVDALVDCINVYDSSNIEIRWKFADEYAM